LLSVVDVFERNFSDDRRVMVPEADANSVQDEPVDLERLWSRLVVLEDSDTVSTGTSTTDSDSASGIGTSSDDARRTLPDDFLVLNTGAERDRVRVFTRGGRAFDGA
jgi:hypothetical protein